MDREQIQQLNGVQPHCFESEREEQWYQAGLVEGLEVADNNPKPNKTVPEILGNYTGTEIFNIKQKSFDDIILWVAERDKLMAVIIIKDFFGSGVYEAKQYLDKITENKK